jgi:hypothetical protein
MATALSSRRVAFAKRAVLGVCAVGFAAAFVLTKASHPSHAKHHLSRLDAPQGFVKQLQDGQLQGGVIAPPQAPPEAQTATS